MVAYHSSDFGWTAGQDVTNEFAALLKTTLKAGDTFILDDMYSISAGAKLQLPDDFTLAAEFGGGFDLLNTNATSSPALLMGDRSTLDNVTITASGAPDTGYKGTHAVVGTDFHLAVAVGIYGANDVTIVNASFSGSITNFVQVKGGNNLTIEDSRFDGGLAQLHMSGGTDDARIVGSHFKDALGDGIKTERIGENGPQRAQVLDCFFEGANRDGIDTAGGFKDSYVANTVFYNNNVSALDLKEFKEKESDLSPHIANSGIVIENCEIIDSRNGIVVTMEESPFLTAQNANQYMPHDIVVKDTIFEKTAAHNEEMRAFLIKDGYDITWTNVDLLGDISELRLMNAVAPDGWSAYNVGGDVDYGVPRNLPVANLWPHNVGPGKANR